jgi:hypothetical protein
MSAVASFLALMYAGVVARANKALGFMPASMSCGWEGYFYDLSVNFSDGCKACPTESIYSDKGIGSFSSTPQVLLAFSSRQPKGAVFASDKMTPHHNES